MAREYSIEDTKVLESRFTFTYQNHLTFENPRIQQRLEKKCIASLQKKKAAKFNHWTKALFQKNVENPSNLPLVVRSVNPLVGYGVFATHDIPALTYIGEYTGMVKKRRWFKDHDNDYIFGFMVGFKETSFVIDAKQRGNFTRFINHSYDGNLLSRWMIYEGICHVIFFSKSFIRQGEQLTYDYGPYYWRRRSYPQEL